jgi:hypothetical protein
MCENSGRCSGAAQVARAAGPQIGDRIEFAYIKLKGFIKKAKLDMQLSTGSVTIDDCHSQYLSVSIDGRVSAWGLGSGNVCCLLISSQPGLDKEFTRRGLILRETYALSIKGRSMSESEHFSLKSLLRTSQRGSFPENLVSAQVFSTISTTIDTKLSQ